MEFRGKPFPGCVYHERPLMRCEVFPAGRPDVIVAYILTCPDCERGIGLARHPRTPYIAITKEEFDALPANPQPFEIHPAGAL